MHSWLSSDPVAQYLSFLLQGHVQAVHELFSGEPHIDDPLSCHIFGREATHRFLVERYHWLRERDAHLELLRIIQGVHEVLRAMFPD